MRFPNAHIFMGLLTLACRQPDRQSSIEPTVRATAGEGAMGDRKPPSPAQEAPRTACIVPMPNQPLPQASVATSCPPASEPPVTLVQGQIKFDDAPGRPIIQVELARSDETRKRGLMYRTKLGSEAGMLFSWDDDATRTFWMHNTCIPLDMLFIAKDGTISGVVEQVPVLNDEPRGIPCPVAHVLEVNAGWVRGHHVSPGQHLTISVP
jgi:hypothetical protein